MPCGDITEELRLTLDANDALRTYALRKRTCGTAIGSESLLLPWLSGMPATAILAATTASLHGAFDGIPEDMEFVYAKHLEALQQGLRTLSGEGDERCTALTIGCEHGEVSFEALVRIADPAAAVPSCGGCGSCGSKSRRKRNPLTRTAKLTVAN